MENQDEARLISLPPYLKFRNFTNNSQIERYSRNFLVIL